MGTSYACERLYCIGEFQNAGRESEIRVLGLESLIFNVTHFCLRSVYWRAKLRVYDFLNYCANAISPS